MLDAETAESRIIVGTGDAKCRDEDWWVELERSFNNSTYTLLAFIVSVFVTLIVLLTRHSEP